MAKAKYYDIDTGFFPDVMSLCFGEVAFQQLLDDSKLSTGLRAFDKGEAETIVIHTHLGDMIILLFDLRNYEAEEDDAILVGVISHEVSHAVEKLGHIIGEDNISGEVRAYLTQSIVEQVYSASLIERKKHARKADRNLSRKKSERKAGDVPKVDVIDHGSAGPDSASTKQDPIHRAKNSKGRSESETENSVSATRRPWVSSKSNSK